MTSGSGDTTVELPMFPLGSVLFPAMPLPLRVFEPRYLAMLQDILSDEAAEFGVVLIERGQEVGGGEQRFPLGTVARISEVSTGEGFVGLLAQGTDRFEVVEWLAEAPYPRAAVRMIPDLEWDPDLHERRVQSEALVRRTLAKASEFDDQRWPSTIGLSEDPVASLWQLAAIAPLGPMDQLALLGADNPRRLLDSIFTSTQDAGESIDAWPDEMV
ncbi:LON peptidase substrate-binding domain-containing protein [Aeromicrobium sp.]|uniref:LON peptidase substrate-binding domain-containing protein n=1 Tax=Aeromicrobium sp. TaxID=1871063 RepID=UPI0019AFA8B6|nr:LON peptidase substrate-binding domain-containing protein [Aeromicrobium sp.]MBC7630098.1 LON peptidase substrate-binding domain-containing protein [Aeromicrobium sp.]